ncbi:MAG: zinc-ribbon domain-containing protein [Clostridia bacterium]|nr:zinc-ribbon domain-containing protein [Clostridia bacterium]
MAFCKNCGQELPVDAKACPNCGTDVEQPTAAPAAAPAAPAADAKDNMWMAVLAYLGILVLIPLLVEPAKNSPFVRFHANQGLILLIVGLLSAIPVLGCVVGVFCLVLTIMGIINAVNGRMKELPLIGRFRLLK